MITYALCSLMVLGVNGVLSGCVMPYCVPEGDGGPMEVMGCFCAALGGLLIGVVGYALSI